MKKVMFICKKNSRRSQIAEGFTRELGQGKISVSSAGLASDIVDPITIQVMSEIGIDITQQISKPLSQFNSDDYNIVISLCGCGVNLPEDWLNREMFEDWQLDDPEGQSINTFRIIRDEIKSRVINLLKTID